MAVKLPLMLLLPPHPEEALDSLLILLGKGGEVSEGDWKFEVDDMVVYTLKPGGALVAWPSSRPSFEGGEQPPISSAVVSCW